MIMLNECEKLWASRAAQALDARLTNHVVAPSVNPASDWLFSSTDSKSRRPFGIFLMILSYIIIQVLALRRIYHMPR